MNDKLLELDQVTFEYAGGRSVLRDLILAVESGEILALLGPSGSGKTTLLHLVAGFLRPAAGTIRIGGEIVSSPSTNVPPRRRGIGMVFQDLALWPHLRVDAHLDFVLRSRGLTRGERRRRKEWVLDVLELRGLSRRLPAELSGGEAQRLALGRALAAHPRLLLLDEPLVALDERLRRKMLELIAHIHAESRTTVLFVTHDPRDALAIASRVAVLVAGEIRQAGRSDEVYRFPESREVAELCGAVSLIAGETEEGGQVRTALGSFQSAFQGGPRCRVVVPLRPEDVEIRAAEVGDATARSARFAGGAWEVEVENAGAVARGRSAAAIPPGSRVRLEIREPVWAFRDDRS